MSKKLINCKTCGSEISKGAKYCPNCGNDNRKFYAKNKVLTILMALFIIGRVCSAVDNKDSDVEVNNVKEEAVEEKTETKVSKYKVTLEDGTYDSSGFAYYVYGTLTNNKKDVDYIQILIPVYDKNGNKLGDAMANCNNLKKGETWRFKAMALEDGIAKFGKDIEVTGF